MPFTRHFVYNCLSPPRVVNGHTTVGLLICIPTNVLSAYKVPHGENIFFWYVKEILIQCCSAPTLREKGYSLNRVIHVITISRPIFTYSTTCQVWLELDHSLAIVLGFTYNPLVVPNETNSWSFTENFRKCIDISFIPSEFTSMIINIKEFFMSLGHISNIFASCMVPKRTTEIRNGLWHREK